MALFGPSTNNVFGVSTGVNKKVDLEDKATQKQTEIAEKSLKIQVKEVIDGDTLRILTGQREENLRAAPQQEGYGFGASELPHGEIDPATRRRLDRIKRNIDKRDGEKFFGERSDKEVFAEGRKDAARLQGIVDQAWSSPEADEASANLDDDFVQPYPVLNLRTQGERDKHDRVLGDLQLIEGPKNLKARDIFGDVLNTPETNLDYNEPWNQVKAAEDHLRRVAAGDRDRTVAEVIKDTGTSLLGKGSNMIAGGVYNAADLATQFINYIPNELDEIITGNRRFKSLDEITEFSQNFARTREFWDDQLSLPTQYDKEQVRQADNEFKLKKAEEKGKRKTTQPLQAVTDIMEEAANSVKSYWDNPLAATDVALESGLMLGGSGAAGQFAIRQMIARETANMTQKQAGKWLASEAGKKAINKTAGIAGITFTGLSEGLSNGLEAKNRILDIPLDYLEKHSPEFNSLLKQDITPETARRILANEANIYVTTVSGLLAAGVSKITGAGQWEGKLFSPESPMGKSLLNNFVTRGTARSVEGGLRETGEESLQGGTGELTQNLATRFYVNPEQKLEENVGTAIGSGAVAGGLSGVAARPVITAATVSLGTVAGAATLAGYGTYKTGEALVNIAKNRSANKTEREAAISADTEYSNVKENIAPALNTTSREYNPIVAVENLLSITEQIGSSRERQLHMADIDKHLDNLREAERKAREGNTGTPEDNQREVNYTTALEDAEFVVNGLKEDAAKAAQAEVDTILNDRTEVSNPESDQYDPFKAVKETRKLYKDMQETPELRQAYLDELGTHVENLKNKATDSGNTKLVQQAIRVEAAIEKDKAKLAKVEERQNKYSTAEGRKVTSIKDSIQKAADVTSSKIRRTSSDFDKITDPNDPDYNAAIAVDEILSSKNLKGLSLADRKVQLDNAEQHLALFDKAIAEVTAKGGDATRLKNMHDDRARKLNDLREGVVTKATAATEKSVDAVKAAASVEEVSPELAQEVANSMVNLLDSEEAINGTLSKGMEENINDETLAVVKATEVLAKTIQKVRGLLPVGQEVLGPGTNGMGKKGLQAHLNTFNAAISKGDRNAARNTVAEVAAFRDSQKAKLAKGGFVNANGIFKNHTPEFTAQLKAEITALEKAIVFMQKLGLETFGQKTDGTSATTEQEYAANQEAEPELSTTPPKTHLAAQQDARTATKKQTKKKAAKKRTTPHKKVNSRGDLSKIKTLPALVTWLREQKDPQVNLVMDAIEGLLPEGGTVEAKNKVTESGAASWNAKKKRLALNLSAQRWNKTATSIEPVAHELVHAATAEEVSKIEQLLIPDQDINTVEGQKAVNDISSVDVEDILNSISTVDLKKAGVTKEQVAGYITLRKLLQELQTNQELQEALNADTAEARGMRTATKNVKELLAQGLTGPAFQKQLQNTQVTPQATAWDVFVSAIAKILGISNPKELNAFAEVMQASSSFISATADAKNVTPFEVTQPVSQTKSGETGNIDPGEVDLNNPLTDEDFDGLDELVKGLDDDVTPLSDGEELAIPDTSVPKTPAERVEKTINDVLRNAGFVYVNRNEAPDITTTRRVASKRLREGHPEDSAAALAYIVFAELGLPARDHKQRLELQAAITSWINTGKTPTQVNKSFWVKALEIIERFIGVFSSKEYRGLESRLTKELNKITKDPTAYTFKPAKGRSKLVFQDVMSNNPGVDKVLQTLSNTGIPYLLTGSFAYADQTAVYRNADLPVHDVDLLYNNKEEALKSQEELSKVMGEGQKLYEFSPRDSNTAHVLGYVYPSKPGQTIVDYKRGFTKKRVALRSWRVVDADGKEVGSFAMIPQKDGTAKDVAKGDAGIAVDFMTVNSPQLGVPQTYKDAEGKEVKLEVSSWVDGMIAKLEFLRAKDIKDLVGATAEAAPGLEDNIDDAPPIYTPEQYQKAKPMFMKVWNIFQKTGKNLATLGHHIAQVTGNDPVVKAMYNQFVAELSGNRLEQPVTKSKAEIPPGEGEEEKVQLPVRNKYSEKDQAKSDQATKFIGRGSANSSTAQYAKAWGDKANSGQYTADDIVFVSVEGQRKGRKGLDPVEIKKATDAKATIITDVAADRDRAHNIGERELARVLTNSGYVETSPGKWNYTETESSVTEPTVTEEVAAAEQILEETAPTEQQEAASLSAVAQIAQNAPEITEDTNIEAEVAQTAPTLSERLLEARRNIDYLADKATGATKRLLNNQKEGLKNYQDKAQKGVLEGAERKAALQMVRHINRKMRDEGTYEIPKSTASKLLKVVGYPVSNTQTLLNELANTPIGTAALKKERDAFVDQIAEALIADNEVTEQAETILREKSNDIFARNGYGNTLTYSTDAAENGGQLAVRNKKGGILNQVPNIWSLLKNPRLRSGLLKAYGIDEHLDFTDQDKEYSLGWMMDEFTGKFREKLAPEYKGSNAPTKINRNRLYDIMNLNNTFSENILTTAALVTTNWLLTRSGDTLYNNPDEVNKLLGYEEGRITDLQILNQIGILGIPAATIEQDIGAQITKHLGIYSPDTADTLTDLQLQIALGQLALATLDELGYVKFSAIDNESMAAITDSEAKNIAAQTVFVRTTVDPKNIYQLHPELITMQESYQKYADVVNSLLNVKSLTTTPTFEPVETAPTHYKGSVTETTEYQREGIIKAQKEPWEAKKSTMPIFEKMSRATMLAIGGFVENINTLDVLAPSVDGKNLSLTTAYDNIVTWKEMGGHNNPFYFAYNVWKNTRMGIASNLVNPQAYKMQRHVYGLSHFRATVDPSAENSDTWDAFRVAVAQAFGQSIDANYLDETLAYFNTLQNDAEIMAAVAVLNSDTAADTNVAYTAEEEAILLAAITKGKEEYWSMDGLAAYAAYVKADGAAFEADIFVEPDGKTNGVISLYRQLPGGTYEDMQLKLNRGGQYFKGDKYKSYAEFINQDYNLDSYESLASHLGPAITAIKQQILLNMQAWAAAPKKFVPGEWYDDFALSIPFAAKNAWSKNSPDFLAIDIKRINVATAEEVLSVISDLVGDFAKEAEEVFNAAKEEVSTSTVDPTARAWAKDPLLTKAYGAGVKAIVNKKIADIETKIFEMIDAGRRGTTEEQDNVVNILRVLTRDPGTREQLFDKDENAVGFKFNKVERRLLQDQIQTFIGGALSNALTAELGHTTANVNWMNTAARFTNEIFKLHYDNKISEREQLTGKPVNRFELEEILVELRDEGLLPGGKHATSTGDVDSLQVIGEQKQPVKGMKGVQTAFTTPITMRKYSLNNEGRLVYVKPTDSKKEKQGSLTNLPTQYYATNDPGVANTINQNLAMDGNTQSGMFNYTPGLNVHDASGFSISTVKDDNHNTEETWDGHQSSHSIATAIQEKMQSLVDSVIKLPIEQQEYLEGLFGDDGLIKVKDPTTDATITFTDSEHFVEEFTNKVNEINELKEQIDNSITVSQQYPYPGSQLIRPVKDTPTESIEDLIPDVVDSSDLTFDRAKFDERYAGNLNKDTATKVFNDLRYEGVSPENDNHSNTLRKVLFDVINPALSRLDSFQILRGIYPDRNRGYIDAQNIYIGAGAGKALLASEMSSQETLTQGLLQALLEAGLQDNTWAKRELTKLFNIAQYAKDDQGNLIITPRTFMKKDSLGNIMYTDTYDNEYAAAQARYDAVFDTSIYQDAYLRNFAALGLTNEAFMTDLAKISRSQKDPTVAQTIPERIVQVFANIMDTMFATGFKTRGRNLDVALYNLVQNVTNVNEEHKKRLQNHLIRWNKYNGVTKQALHRFVYDPYIKYTTSRIGKSRTASIPRVIVDGLISTPAYALSEDFREQRRKVYGRIHTVEGSLTERIVKLGRSLAFEIGGPTTVNQHWHNFVRESKYLVDSLRERQSHLVKEQTKELFDPNVPISEAGWESLNAVVLKGDLSSVSPAYTPRQLATMLENNSELTREIDKVESQLGRYGLNNRTYYVAQSDSLGHYMARGSVGLDGQKLNAHNIVNHVGTTKASPETTEQAEKLVDQLASLYAIRYTAKHHRDYVAERIRHEYAREVEVNGIEFMLATHQNFKEESLKRNFNNNKTQMVKGYTTESYNPMYQHAVSNSSNDYDLIQGGYEYIGEVDIDDLDPNRDRRYIYRSKHGQLQRYQAGGVSMKGTVAKGSDAIDVAYQTGAKNHAFTEAKINNARMHTKVIANTKKQFVPGFKPNYKKNYMIPTFDPNGLTADYRYVMNEMNKINIMGKKDLANEVLGNMVASVEAKENTDKMNRKAIRLAKEDYDNYFNDNPEEFVYIGEDALDPKMKEKWQMLPSNMREDMQKVWGRDGMYVKEDYMNMIFGFRKLSFTDLVDEHIGLHPQMKASMHIAGKIWQAVVAMAKRRIVILTPAVLVANVTSNFMLSLAKGMPFRYIIRQQVAALADLAAYQKDVKERDKLQNILDISSNIPNRRQKELKLARLKAKVDTNIVNELVSQGIFQSIIEDVDDTQTNELINIGQTVVPGGEGIVEKFSNATPEIIKNGYRVLTLAPDTQLGNTLMKATQYSDFVARYALYKYQTEVQKIDKQKALEEVVDTFINYDENTSPEVQYLNDMGIMMYTKFLFRIQRQIFRSFREKPAEAFALQAAQAGLWNVPDIPESNLITNGYIERMNVPFSPDVIDDAFTFSLLNYIPFL